MKVCVIGGGPAGLTTLKTLLGYAKSHAGEFDVILLESSDKLGGTFDQRAYEHGELVSSRQLTAFSDLRIKGPDHVPMEIYVKYLNDYADAFSLHEPVGEAWKGTAVEGGSRIQLGCRVTRMDKIAAGGHRITFERTAKVSRHSPSSYHGALTQIGSLGRNCIDANYRSRRRIHLQRTPRYSRRSHHSWYRSPRPSVPSYPLCRLSADDSSRIRRTSSSERRQNDPFESVQASRRVQGSTSTPSRLWGDW